LQVGVRVDVAFTRDSRTPSISEAWFSSSEKISASLSPAVRPVMTARLAM
jgi:hypothetical protein